jgi:hypothetical protein
MTDFLSALWAVLSFLLGLIWSVVWFILSDLLSTLLWMLIVVWLLFSVRYRSFTTGGLALLRYGRYGAQFLWRWLRGKPASLPEAGVNVRTEIQYRRHVPFGHVSLSEQLNMALVASVLFLALA